MTSGKTPRSLEIGKIVITENLLLALFATAGLAGIILSAPPQQARLRVEAGLWALLGALVGGRIGYVAAAWPYYQDHQAEIGDMLQGGLSASGAFAGGLLFACLFAALFHQPLGEIWDALAPLAASLGAGGWLSAWVVGAAYGEPNPIFLLNLPARDEWGTWQPRLMLPVLGAVASLAAFLIIDSLRRVWIRGRRLPVRSRENLAALHFPWNGWSGSLALLVLGLVNFSLSFLRSDPSQTWRGWRLDAWGWVGCASLAAAAWLYFYLMRGKQYNEGKSRSRTDQHPVRQP